MASYKGSIEVAAMVVVLLILSALFADNVHCSSDDCTVVSLVLESCYENLQSGQFFMISESVCCKSLEILENRIQDLLLSRYAVCECFKASDSDKELLVNENLLEVQALCGPHVPYSISANSDCLQYANYGMNIAMAALER